MGTSSQWIWFVEGTGKWGKYRRYGPCSQSEAQALAEKLRDPRITSKEASDYVKFQSRRS